MERLQKVLARAGVASRRACETMISAGRVTVNGQVVTELGAKVDPDADTLAVDGRVVSSTPPPVYIMINKPVGYLSTTSDPQGRPTVLSLLAQADASRLYPVGRLDAESEGLLLLTNDGKLTERLTHPRYELEKEYLVWVEGLPTPQALASLRAGVPLDGRPAPVDAVTMLDPPSPGKPNALLRVIIHEGRKREVRRLCQAVGHPVRRLLRVRMGPLRLGHLAAGETRPLTADEIKALAELPTPPAPVIAAGSAAAPGLSRRPAAATNHPTKTRRRHAKTGQETIHHRH